MRTFHTGGVAGDDITQGLPRIQELFEARNPKGQSVISKIDGIVDEIKEGRDRQMVVVRGDEETSEHPIPYNARKTSSIGDKLEAGEELTEGPIDRKELKTV